MDDEAPKPMKKVHRNIFRKMGKKLEKFEQSLGLPQSSSTNDLSFQYYRPDSQQQNDEEDDSTSLQYHPQSDSPKAVLRHQQSNQSSYGRSSIASDDTQSSIQWQSRSEESNDSFSKDSSKQYDKEVKILCQDLMENRDINLHDCRDYDKKISLLRIALSFNTPKITVPVILFLENTLSKPLFYELIRQYPTAVKNYINIAKLRLENEYYIAMLKQFGKNEDVALIRLRQANENNDFHKKMASLDQAAVEFTSHPWWYSQVNEYKHLLNKQREWQTSLSTAQTNIHLENRTLLDTYKMVYDTDFRRQKFHRQTEKTPVERCKEVESAFHITSEMIMCARLSVIMQYSARTHYDDFVHQAMHQGFFGRKYVIAPENYADMVYNWIRLNGEGPEKASEKTERFLNMIHHPGRRVYYAEKFKNYDVAIDTIANVLRDRMQLELLLRRMPQDHPSFNRATSLLESTKWRN